MDKKIEKIIHKCLLLMKKGYSLDECINKFESYQDEIIEYFKVIKNIKGLGVVIPKKDYQKNSLNQIIGEAKRREGISSEKAASTAVLRKNAFTSKKRLLLRPAVIFLVFLVAATFSFAGTLFASKETVPGQVLYPLKKSFEDFKLIVYPESQKDDLHFQFLNNRIDEANILLGSDETYVAVLVDDLIIEIDMEYQICKQFEYFSSWDEDQFLDSINNIKNMHERMYGKNGNSSTGNGQKNNMGQGEEGNTGNMGQMGNNGGSSQNMGR